MDEGIREREACVTVKRALLYLPISLQACADWLAQPVL